MSKYAFIVLLAMAAAVVAIIVPATGQNVTTDIGAGAAAAVNSTGDGSLDAAPIADLVNDTKPVVNVTDVAVPVTEVPTAATTTTTTVAPVSTKHEVPAPETHSYSVPSTTASDKYCILVTSAVQFTVVYPDVNHTMLSTTFNAGGNSTVHPESTCGNVSAGHPAILIVNYTAGYLVQYTFTVAPKDANKYALTQLSLIFTYGSSDLFPGHDPKDVSIHTLSATNNETYVVSKDHSYRCDVEKTLELIAATVLGLDNNLNGTAGISSFKFAAFGQFDKDNYGEAEECSDDFTTSDIVPIAVGCALAALVVIVLIAYLIGRRRSRQKGYQSV